MTEEMNEATEQSMESATDGASAPVAAAGVRGPAPAEMPAGMPAGAPKGPKGPGKGAPSDKVMRMGTGSIPKLTIEFAIPAIAGMVVNGAYNIVDSIFLGQAVGELGLAAMTVAAPIMTMLMAIAMLIGNGGNAYAALKLGEGDHVEAERSLGNTVFLAIAISAIVALLALCPPVLDGLLTVASVTDDIRPMTTSFVRILAFGFIFQMIGAGVNNFIRTAGAPARALWTTVIGLIASTILNYLFVIVLGWGVDGSAWATVLGMLVSAVVVLWYFVKTPGVPIRIRPRFLRPKLHTIRMIVTLGIASFVLQAGMCVINFVLNALLVQYGALSPIGADNALASIGVVSRIAMFTVFPLIGTSIAVQPLLGFNYGARNFDRVRKTLWFGVGMATVFSVVFWAAVHLWPQQIVAAFGIEADLADFTVFALQVQLAMLPFVGYQIVCSNYFQATGQPLKSSILSLTRQIIFLLPLYVLLPRVLPTLLPQYNGLDALYFAVPLSDFLAIFTVTIFIIIEMGRLKKLERGELQVTL